MKKSIGQAKQVTKEQKGKFLNAVCWAFVAKQRHDEWCSSLPLIRLLSLRCATNGQRTKTKTLRFECAESEKLKGIKGQLATEERGPTSWSARATKTPSSWFFGLDYAWGLKIWSLGVWWRALKTFKASPFWFPLHFLLPILWALMTLYSFWYCSSYLIMSS